MQTYFCFYLFLNEDSCHVMTLFLRIACSQYIKEILVQRSYNFKLDVESLKINIVN